MRRPTPIDLVLSGLLLASGAANAQPAQTLNVTFVLGDPAAVPLSHWVGLVSSLVIVAVAFGLIRRTKNIGRLSCWVLVIAAAGVASLLFRADFFVKRAKAQTTATPFPLVVSPETIVIPVLPPNLFSASNSTERALTITNMYLQNAPCRQIYFPSTTCFVGQTLSPGQACLIVIEPILDLC
jgi:hypothetical protein